MTCAGFATSTLTPDAGVPLGGFSQRRRNLRDISWRQPYARLFTPSTGVLDPIRAKAFVLEHEARKLLFLSLDVVGITPECHQAIVNGVTPFGFDAEAIVVCATHTHSGPGAITRKLLWEALAMDLFKRAVLERFVTGAVDAVRRADAAREPASLSAVSFAAMGLQRNRLHPSGFYDPTANVLMARSSATGKCLGAMVNLAIHGTALQSDNLKFSADVPGGIERALQSRLDAPVLFVNGAVGDVSPVATGVAGIEIIGEKFADQAMTALAGARPIAPAWSVQSRAVRLPSPRLHLGHCNPNGWIRRPIGLTGLVPRRAMISTIRLGDMVMLAWPGEPTTPLGLAAKGVAEDAGAKQAWILGLTNGYVGYFVTTGEYEAGGYEACAALYGPDAGAQMVDAFRSLLEQT